MSFESIVNRGEFFSDHYLDAVIGGDLGDLRKRWDETEKRGDDTARSRIRGMGQAFFAARAAAADAEGDRRVAASRLLNDVVLEALGFAPDRRTLELARGEVDTVRVPVAHEAETGTGRLLVALDAGFATDPDELFDEAGDASATLLDPVHLVKEKQEVRVPAEAVGALFSVDEPPRYVLVVAGCIVLLAERSKWAEGRFLAVDIDTALERRDVSAKGELATIAALFSADALVPEEGPSVLDALMDKSHRHAVGVSKELRDGIRQSVEILANEVICQRVASNLAVYSGPNRVDSRDLTRQCLRWLYRLLVLLYAESRPELGVLPTNDEAYLSGYSVDRLRELCLVDLDSDRARGGSHLHESLKLLFRLVNEGYHAEHAAQALVFDVFEEDRPTYEEYLQFPGLDAALFDPKATPLLDGVTLRNEELQRVLILLLLSPEGRGKRDRGFISYAQLGINQLGAVYEGLMAYTGFFATQDLYEIAKNGDPSDGTWVLPVEDADDYPDDVFVRRTDPITGREERVQHEKGSFVFRLSGRDRQRSASYYTPEVLTRCVVKHALAELLGLDDYAPENGSSGITEARQILALTICEPALGSGAFLNEAINQISAEYLRRRQSELGETLDPETYRRELQKVKAHFALHQSYGVDLNATAIELAEVSLWLNCMHPGLKAPWFGLQLRRGNSLVGCRRATWRTSQLASRPWAKTKKGEVSPPVDRKLSDGPLDHNEIHHFLLPGHGWAAVADRSEAKEFRPEETKALKEWRKTILKAPGKNDAKRLQEIARAVEERWSVAADRIRLTQMALRRNLGVYGAEEEKNLEPVSRAEAERIMEDENSSLGRLRTLMDAWVGLWFWPLDTGIAPPIWNEWLSVCEDILVMEERHGPSGQLAFDDLQSLLESEDEPKGIPVAELRERHRWLAVALDAASREGAWHWELEFSPVFQRGGFNLQVGNPPWVRPIWKEDLVLAEIDPWWGVTEKAPTAERNNRRGANLATIPNQRGYLDEVAWSEGLTETLSSPMLCPVLTGIQTNLYMVFMDSVWRHASINGITGLLHPESHFTDPSGGPLRASAYRTLRRHWQFVNEIRLFEIGPGDNHLVFGAHVYGHPRSPNFFQVSGLLHPLTLDGSVQHEGSGETPGIKTPDGDWDLRPHAARILTITEEVLGDWARLFDEPGTPAGEARLLRPITNADLEAVSVLADQPTRLADQDYHWTAGWHEKGAKEDGIIRWETAMPLTWDEVILQGPHFTVATPFAKQPNENCRTNRDYSEWDLETLPERLIPRTNYQRACDRESYDTKVSALSNSSRGLFRVFWRRMTQPGLERSLHAALFFPGPMHSHLVHSLAFESPAQTVAVAGLWASLPVDYLVKVSGRPDIQGEFASRLPAGIPAHMFDMVALRALRLNCLTVDYELLWSGLYQSAWTSDCWTDSDSHRVALGAVEPEWSAATPLRRDSERRYAQVELDALAALILGLAAKQLCAMYRTQFAVLRKYEHRMAFDAEGRKICAYHQSAGYRQAQLQERAKQGELPPEWRNVWSMFESYEEDPSSVDWLGHYTPPFTRPDREKEMTRAYEEFQRRLEAGEYE